jgi:hypothetical protein
VGPEDAVQATAWVTETKTATTILYSGSVTRKGNLVIAATLAAVEAIATGCTTGNIAVPTFDVNTTNTDADAGADGMPSCRQVSLPDGGLVHVTGTVVEATSDGAAPKPIPGAMISTEYGGLYLPYCDLAHASPYYVFGAVADGSGNFAIDVKEGALGFHSFATGYFYSRAPLDTTESHSVSLIMEPLPKTLGRPTVANAAFDHTKVVSGTAVTFSADVHAASAQDPLSDELVLVEPTRSWSVELDPPGLGKKDDFPDGTWKRTFTAPDTPGTYTYFFSATTGTCVTSDVVSVVLEVQAP